jgi:hypothetical protein
MGNPRLTYNSKAIDFDKYPSVLYVDPFIPRTINGQLAGATECRPDPRTIPRITVEWPPIDDATLLMHLYNWWIWAQKLNTWTLALDSAQIVNTTLTAEEPSGETTVAVASASGIAASSYYKLLKHSNYQLVKVDSIASLNITLTGSLDYTFASGAYFRDQYFFQGKICDENARCPITLLPAPEKNAWPPTRFRLAFSFHEAIT